MFLPIAVSTSGRVYEDFTRLLFLHTHRETSILAGELPEESEQFRFLRASRLSNLKGSVGLILAKASAFLVECLDISSLTLAFFYSAVIKSSSSFCELRNKSPPKSALTHIQISSNWPSQKMVHLTAFTSLTQHTMILLSHRKKTPRTRW